MKPVDVLAVMDGARRTISAQSKLSDDVMAHIADDVAQARDAVAELIAATSEYESAANGFSGTILMGLPNSREARERFTAARAGMRAALARVSPITPPDDQLCTEHGIRHSVELRDPTCVFEQEGDA